MKHDSPTFWTEAAQQFQQSFRDNLNQAMQSLQGLEPGAAAGAPVVTLAPHKLQELQQQYMAQAAQLWNDSMYAAPTSDDKRFKAQAWAHNPVSAFSASTYLLNARTLMAMAEAVEGDEKARGRIRFGVEQWMAAAAPSNFLALNAEAQQ